jgi:spindle assembly abnormal protein 6
LAVLNTLDADGQSVFSIVETNPFKQLTHLSLRFFPGDDAAIKAYLAARLAQVGASRRSLSTSLKQTSEELQITQRSEAKLQQQLSALGYEAESTLSQEKMRFADELEGQRKAAAAALKAREEELNAKIDALVERYEKEVRELAQRWRTIDANSLYLSAEKLQAVKAAAETSEAQVQDLSKQKYQHEMQIDHLQAQSQDLSQGRSALAVEVDELRTQNKELDQKVFQQEKQLNALQVRADALQQQLADKEEVIKKTTDLLQSAKLHNEEVDESLKMYRDNHSRLQQKLELSISEINKVGRPRHT